MKVIGLRPDFGTDGKITLQQQGGGAFELCTVALIAVAAEAQQAEPIGPGRAQRCIGGAGTDRKPRSASA